MKTCTECGHEGMTVIGRVGSRRDCRCEVCGHKSWILVTSRLGPGGSEPNMEPMYWLTGRWVGKPEVPQVLEVRKQFPQVQPAGFSALWRQAVAHAEINFGCNIQSHNAYLETLLNPLGLVTTQTADE